MTIMTSVKQNPAYRPTSIFLKGFGISAKLSNLDCEGDAQRSFNQGYEADVTTTTYKIDYRIFY